MLAVDNVKAVPQTAHTVRAARVVRVDVELELDTVFVVPEAAVVEQKAEKYTDEFHLKLLQNFVVVAVTQD